MGALAKMVVETRPLLALTVVGVVVAALGCADAMNGGGQDAVTGSTLDYGHVTEDGGGSHDGARPDAADATSNNDDVSGDGEVVDGGTDDTGVADGSPGNDIGGDVESSDGTVLYDGAAIDAGPDAGGGDESGDAGPAVDGGADIGPDGGADTGLRITFSRAYGTVFDEYGVSIAQTSDEGFVVGGITPSADLTYNVPFVLKIDPLGQIEWQKEVGSNTAGRKETARAILQMPDGGYVLVALVSMSSGMTRMWMIVKLDSTGAIQWQETINNSERDEPLAAVVTPDGGFAVIGNTDYWSTIPHMPWLVKFRSNGTVEWQKYYEITEVSSAAYYVRHTADGGYVLAGVVGNSVGASPVWNVWVAKLTSSGGLTWQKELRDADTTDWKRGQIVIEQSNGEYMVGSSRMDNKIWLTKLSTQGKLLWSKEYSGDNNLWMSDLVQTPDAGYLLLATGDNGNYLIKTNSVGEIEWQRTYLGGVDGLSKMKPTKDGGYVLVGSSKTFGLAGSADIWVLKMNPDGTLNGPCPQGLGDPSNLTASPLTLAVADTAAQAKLSFDFPGTNSATGKDGDMVVSEQCMCQPSDGGCNVGQDAGCAPDCAGKCGGDDQCGGICPDNCVAPQICGGGGTLNVCGGITIYCGPSPTGKGGDVCDVPEGAFQMGCNNIIDAECYGDERPYHVVTVRVFKIDMNDVTASDYRTCVDAGGCTAAGTSTYCNYNVSGKENHPINCVDWNQAQTYCQWVGKRLPTEAEWEKAARGTDGRKYPWGNTGLDCDHAVMSVNPCSNSGTAPVGSKPAGASPYGALDMLGNVWQWVEDDWHATYVGAPTSGSAWVDSPRGPYRVSRGGGWIDNVTYVLRASYRDYSDPTSSRISLGFRCALD